MDIRLQTEAPEAILPQQEDLKVPVSIKGKQFFLNTGRNKDLFAGKQLSLELMNELSLVTTYEDGVNNILSRFQEARSPFVVSFANAHCFNLCHRDSAFRSAIQSSDIVFRDGKGIEILCKSAGINPGVNMCGTDTIPMVLEKLKDSSVALLGTEDRYLSKAASVLREKGNKVVLIKNGFEAIEEYVDWIEEIQPRIIVLGMGMPKQELLSILLKEKLSYCCLVINGGAIIDHLGGKVSRAPKWMRQYGLEWFYRLMLEPTRLFKRYVIGNVMFMLHTYRATGRIKF